MYLVRPAGLLYVDVKVLDCLDDPAGLRAGLRARWVVQPVLASPTSTSPSARTDRQATNRWMSGSGSPPSFNWNLPVVP